MVKDRRTILIAEDDEDIMLALSTRLEVSGYTVIGASDGEAALHRLKEEKPDLLLLDLMLPKINGFEVCRMIKFDEQCKNLPVIVVSALHEKKDRDKAVESGADAYFIKPFDLKALLDKIKVLLDKC